MFEMVWTLTLTTSARIYLRIMFIRKEIRIYHGIFFVDQWRILIPFQMKWLIYCFRLEPTQVITTTLIQSTESSMQSSNQQTCTMSKCQQIDFLCVYI